jgi:5-carboxymethyl-2-hydroxymuconate isomerase
MPHILIEFTEALASDEQVESLLDAIHTTVAATELFDEEHIRVRAYSLHHYRCGSRKRHFIHAQLRIHAGRSNEQKHRLSNAVLSALHAQQWPAEVITVEVVEMERESYAKFTRD